LISQIQQNFLLMKYVII